MTDLERLKNLERLKIAEDNLLAARARYNDARATMLAYHAAYAAYNDAYAAYNAALAAQPKEKNDAD
jgi:hypothetical protein